MTNRYIYETALAQSAVDLTCTTDDLKAPQPVAVISAPNEKARKYLTLPFDFQLVSYGSSVVASTNEALRQTAFDYIAADEPYTAFETPRINDLSARLAPHGLHIQYMADYFLPDLSRLHVPICTYRTRVLYHEDFADLYTPAWHNALCIDRKELDVLGVAAYNEDGKMVGLAACSADCDEMWQIGIDVLPAYRRQHIGSHLTAALALEIIGRGKVPFYCAAWSNVRSTRNAVTCGFYPAWVELTAKK